MKNRVYENPIIGDKVTFIKTSEETNGESTLIEVELKAGGGNSLHYHKSFSEKFEVINGELTVHAGKDIKVMAPGETFTVPPKMHHNFQNNSDKTITFRVEISPGHSGFENCIKIGYGLATDGRTSKKGIPDKISHLAVLLNLGDTNLPGIYTLISSFLNYMAAKARKNGVEKSLLEAYCM